MDTPVLIASDFDATNQELDELAAFLERLFAVALDLVYGVALQLRSLRLDRARLALLLGAHTEVERNPLRLGAVSAEAYSDDGEMWCGHVCPECVGRGEKWLERRPESNAQWARETAEGEGLSLEGISELPTLEEYTRR
jgi:hypothetical protein